MRDHVLLSINGQPCQIFGADVFLSLSDYLRLRLRLTGTKIVCSEGDCGSCTVLLGRRRGAAFAYYPVDSCIQWMFQLDGAHVVTVEGLAGRGTELTPVQQAMVDCHGSQCGFCTPGFVMAMTGVLENEVAPDDETWRCGLTGNLCRCTGYVPIVDAARSISPDQVRRLNDLYPPESLQGSVNDNEAIEVEATSLGEHRRVFSPTTLSDALQFLQRYPAAKVVAGATDVGVQLNKGVIDPAVLLDLNRVAELATLELTTDGTGERIVAGARATWTDLGSLVHEAIPDFFDIFKIFGSPQIRHVGTIGGNIINASPIADSLPFLFVSEANLELASASSTRMVPINRFYRGYKKFDLQPAELLTRVHIPVPPADVRLRLFKISRRRDLDISTFTAAIWLRLSGDKIAEARLAIGACGPTVIRAAKTEEFLRGRAFDEATMRAAGDVIVTEIAPIDDVRGSADFRRQLARNVLVKFYLEQSLATV